MKKRRIRHGSIKHNILCILYHAPLLPRKQIHFTLKSRRDRINDMLRDLISNGLVAMKEVMHRNCCYLTDSGLQELYRLNEMTSCGDAVNLTHRDARKERDLRIGQTVNILQSSGIRAFEHTKPHIETIISILNGKPLGDIEDNWDALRPAVVSTEDLAPLLRQGLFYNSSVIKKALKMRGIMEPAKSGRFVGVVLSATDIYMCYHTLNRMVQFDDVTERSTWSTVRHLFCGYGPYQKYIDTPTPSLPDAIVFAQSIKMLPALTTGHLGGVNQSPRVIKYRRNMKFLSAKTKLFSSMFFFSTDEFGIEQLRMFPRLSRSCRFTDIQSFFDARQHMGYFFTGNLPYLQASHSSGANAVCLPFYDVKQLYDLRSANQEVIVFLPEGHEDHVSIILGPLLRAAYSFDDVLLHPSRYTIRGERIEERQP